MADAPQKVTVQASRLDSSMLPRGLSQAYWQHLIMQGTDLNNIANASNEANQLAYEATVKNQQQDLHLADHDSKIKSLRSEVDDHESRITANTEGVSSIGGRVGQVETDLSSIQGDYVSKSAVTQQSLSGPFNVATSYSVGGVKVIGPRRTGWTAATGNSLLGTFNSDLSQSVSATYVPSELVAINANLVAARRRIKAIEDALRAHGLIDG